MSWCCYRECPSDCMESDCNCPCHQDALEDANSEDANNEEMEEGLCPHHTCRNDCSGYSDDCNCPCHQDALEAWCRAERGAEATAAELAALKENSAEKRNASEDQSK